METLLPVFVMAFIVCLQSTSVAVSCVRKIRHGWRPTWRMFGSPFQGCCRQRPEDEAEENLDAAQTLLDARIEERRRELIEGMAVTWTRACGAWATISVLRFVLGFPGGGTVTISTIYLAMYLSVFIVRVFPQILKRHLTLWLHFWMQGLLFCWGANLAIWHKCLYDLMRTGSILFRVGIGIAHPTQFLNAFWNVAWGVLGIIFRDSDVPLSTVIAYEMQMAMFMLFVVSKFDEIQTAQVRSDVKASGYLRAKKTMERLLADMCDAVVELDPELRVRQACPKLAGLLLKHAGNTALRGDSFPGLALTDEEGNRFTDFIEQRAVPMAHEQNMEGDRRRSSMFMNLRDSTGTPVSVQVFHSCHHDPSDQLCHVVGVCEVENHNTEGARDTLGAGNWREGVERPPVVRNSITEDASEAISEAGRQFGLGDGSESVASSCASSFTGSEASDISVHTVPVVPQGDMAEYTMLFDAVTDEIIATTMSFPSITGPLRFRANLENFIVDYDVFRAWLDKEIQTILGGGQFSGLGVKIVPVANRKEAHFEFNTEVCILDIHREVLASQLGVENPWDAEDEQQHDLLLVLVFKKPLHRWRPKGIKERRRRRKKRAEPVLPPQPRNQFVEIAL